MYEVSERGTSWLGPFLFGAALQWTGSYRIAILSLVVFFVLGLALLLGVNVRKAALRSRQRGAGGGVAERDGAYGAGDGAGPAATSGERP